MVFADPDDDKYLAPALEGRAEFIISGDLHLLELRVYQGIEIIKPADYLLRL